MAWVDPEYAELIGNISIVWNYLEDTVGYILPKYFEHDQEISIPVLAALDNRGRIDLLLHFVDAREDDAEVAERVRYFAKAFSICRDNRNILVHSAVRLGKASSPEHLEKTSRRKLGGKVRYAYDLDVIRRALREMETTLAFITRLFLTIYLPLAWRAKALLGEDIGDKGNPRPLPKIPPLPKQITPLSPEQGAPPPPHSSER